MRAVVQRVSKASVLVHGDLVGSIDQGLLVYLGVGKGDTEIDVSYLAKKVVGLRIFSDEEGLMNRSVVEVGGRALVISQFTLHGDVRRGRRPSFVNAMEPEEANRLYLDFIGEMQELGVACEKGIFRAMMDVASSNDGPVTILLDSKKLF